jgi:hypothetical protein
MRCGCHWCAAPTFHSSVNGCNAGRLSGNFSAFNACLARFFDSKQRRSSLARDGVALGVGEVKSVHGRNRLQSPIGKG